MEIHGEIDVYIRDKDTGVIVDHIHTTNTFTNIGKQHVLNWLLHDNYSEDVVTASPYKDGGGRSLSHIKQVPYTQVESKTVGTHSYNNYPYGGNAVLHPASAYAERDVTAANGARIDLYPNRDRGDWDSNGAAWSASEWNYGTMHFEFSEPKHLIGFATREYRGDQADWATFCEWSVSSLDFATADDNTDYTPVHITKQGSWRTEGPENERANQITHLRWFYNHADDPDPFRSGSVLENVKTLRLTTRTDGSTQWVYFYGLWFFEPNFYPNTPSVIALGTDNTASVVTNTALGAESNRGWMIRAAQPTDNTVQYTRRLAYDEGNDITYREIGLFFNPTAGEVHGGENGPSNSTSLFARGVFGTPWSKTSAQVVDVDYTLTLV
jgi:hypothetical protein